MWDVARVLDMPHDGVFVVVAAESGDLGSALLPGYERALADRRVGSVGRHNSCYELGIVSIGSADRVADVAEVLAGHATGRVGLSPSFAGLENTPRALRLAHVAGASVAAGEPWVASFEDSPMAMLVAAAPEESVDIAHRVLRPVLALPAADRALLLDTLENWINNGGSTKRSAAELKRTGLAWDNSHGSVPPLPPDHGRTTGCDHTLRFGTTQATTLADDGREEVPMTVTRRTTPSSSQPTGERGRPLPYRRAVPAEAVENPTEETTGLGRRSFLSWAIAAPTLMVGTSLVAGLVDPKPADASIPAIPELADLYDLGDLQDDAALPTSNLITITVDQTGNAMFAMPRAEVGQGMTTSTAMIIAEELDLRLSRVHVSLADSRPELLFNQLTGGSNTTRSTYLAIRTAAGLARLRLIAAAAKKWGVDASTLTTSNGVVKSKTGKSATYGSLAVAAATSKSTLLQVQLKPVSQFKILGTPQNRIDALDAVTGRKTFALDMQVPDTLPTMVARPPTINGTPRSVRNRPPSRRCRASPMSR